MIINYFKTALRNLKKHTAYSLINITGLAIGMACTILILLWVQDELKFDKWHPKKDRIRRVLVRQTNGGVTSEFAVTPAALSPNMQKDFPEIESMCRFKNWGQWLFKYGDGEYIQANSGAIDSTAFNVFGFKFISGGPEGALTDIHSVVLTQEIAERIFGDEDPVGKMVEVRDRGAFKITGVIENVEHSHFDFEFLFPFPLIREDGENIDEMGRGSYNFTTYFLLKNENLVEKAEERLERYLDTFHEENETLLFSQSINDIYLKSAYSYDFTFRGDMNNVITFSAIAFLVLLIACINFMNLTTARSSNRAKEIGLRKVVGAKRKNVVSQFFSESILMSLLSFLIAVVFVILLLPKFNQISGKEFTLGLIADPYILFMLIIIALITGVLAGSYPALYLSAFNPIKVLKGKLSSGAKSSALRKVLVIIQFTLSVALIVSTILISQQLKYIKNKNLGYEKHNLIFVGINNNLRQDYNTIKDILLKDPNIEAVTTSRVLPVYACPSMTLRNWEGKEDDRTMTLHFIGVGFDFLKTMKIEMVEGRAFSEEYASDTINSIIVNEEAVRQIGFEDPIGKSVTIFGETAYIVGVMKDFNFNNVKNKIAPLMLHIAPDQARLSFIRLNPLYSQETLKYIENTWKSFEPDFEFNYQFMDERLDNLYRAEQRSNTLINYFTIFAIFISCLGIFGLASFMAEQKTKEIGIRKVMGASVSTIVRIFSVEFMKLVIIGNIIACPIAYYAMNKWLQGFAYHTEILWWMFALGAVLSVVVVVITIAYQSYKAATKNPAESLRYE